MSALRTADFQERRRARSAMVLKRVQMIDAAIDYLDALDVALRCAEMRQADRDATNNAMGNTYRALERAREASQ